MANKNSHKKTKPKSHKSHLKPQALINDFVLASKAPSPSRNVSPISNSPLDGSSVEHKNPSLDGSLEANCAKVKALSLVEHLINPLDGSLDGDCSEDGEFEEEQLDFSCSEEEYATSPPPPSSPALESGWLVYKFQSEEDKWSVLSKGPYLVYGRPLILRSMSEYFNFSSSEMYQVPVWIQFPYLPLKCWTPLCLSKLANRISYARVLVEVDLLADLRSSINVSLPNGNSLIQKVIYETLPKFCKHCKVLGHSTGTCSKGKEEGKNFEQAGPAATKSNAKVNGYDSTHTLKSHVNDRGNDLNHVVAPSVEVPPIAPPSADGPELVAPADAWQIVQKRRQSSRNKQQTHSFLPAECNPPAQQKVSKGKTPVPSVDIAGIKAPHCPGVGVLTRSSVQKNSNPFSGSGGVPPTIPHP
ncbi:hypothetical protein NC653_002172 [Populus alba x Populus x berolinensis]|uniref:DUF4283 domain-containing protein n=1 Tax=Populus alba x Populus x berolinensis TaxID=444605 RepID=A0AAD6RN01_9ROSI|nr:hypothetical protein NC653_002172 [Populus alba x Populus x berolinensis]